MSPTQPREAPIKAETLGGGGGGYFYLLTVSLQHSLVRTTESWR